MRPFIPAVLIAACLALVLSGCGRDTPAPAAAAPLARPVLTLTASTGAVLIPRALIVERGGLPGVFVLNADGIARFQLVRTGHGRDGRVEVVSGLTGTETLVAGDLNDVRDGSPVTVVKR